MEKLMEEIFTKENLNQAYKQVKKNKGVCGVDGMSIEDALKHLQQNGKELIKTIMEGKYKPQPVMAVKIPKDDGSTRQLGIPSVIDRIIQQAINQVMIKIYDKQFHDNSFGFRPSRRAQQAITKAQSYINEGYKYIVDIDLKKYFDTINQDKLMYLLSKTIKDKRLLRLINQFMKSGISHNGKVSKSLIGVPQGSPLSPILSNIYLNELDKELDIRGLKFVRYADDVQIYVKSERSGLRVLEKITKYLMKELKVEVNLDKSEVRLFNESKFLGFSFYKYKDEIRISIHAKSRSKFKIKVKEILRRNRGRKIETIIHELNRLTRGWINYFKISDNKSLITGLNGWIRRKIRVYIWKQWKKVATRFNNLKKLGVNKYKAWEYANTRKGIWRISCSPILSRTLTNDYISKLGYLDLNKLYNR